MWIVSEGLCVLRLIQGVYRAVQVSHKIQSYDYDRSAIKPMYSIAKRYRDEDQKKSKSERRQVILNA